MAEKTAQEILATRLHPFLKNRYDQIRRGLLVLDGGRPYVEERLEKFPCETDIEFKSRRSKAYLSNHARRICQKISQHLFIHQPIRTGIDEEFALDVSMTGDQQSLQDLIVRCNELLSATGWCWVRVDRPGPLMDEDGNPIDQSLVDKQARGDRVYLSVYDATQVVDWSFDDRGRLRWLLTEEIQNLKPADPFSDYHGTKTRTLWYPGMAETYEIVTKDEDGREKQPEAKLLWQTPFSLGEVPFVLLGKPAGKPIAFEDIECIQAQLLNTESSHSYSLWKSQFAMLVLPDSMIRNLTEQGYDDNGAMAIIISEGRAIVEEAQDQGTTRYIAPPASDLQVRREEVAAMRDQMYDTLGLFLRRSGRQVESAEAKEFDHLDVQAFLSERAEMLEQFERRIVAMAVKLDPLFADYDPHYNRDFKLRDLVKDMQAVILSMGMGMPEEVTKFQKIVALDLIEEAAGMELAPDQKQELVDAINAQEEEEVRYLDRLAISEPQVEAGNPGDETDPTRIQVT